MRATYETRHIIVITSFNHDATFKTQTPLGVYWDTATAPRFIQGPLQT